MGEVKRYSYSDLKAKHEAENATSELHRRPAPASTGSHEVQATSGIEAELNGVWNIMKNVNATSLGLAGGSSPASLHQQPLPGALPGLNAASRTNYYSRYGGPSKTAAGAVKRHPDEGAVATDDYRRQIAGDGRPVMLPKDEWRSFRSK